ncbi:hypothetical protein KI688_011315 [Linnemannia hyalina]|uniref:Uncharacterized protein n=1 Tax=Linnemannia hyalina TaxID=64524 RepID=A0A9P7XW31_9FUNG|nr:hypothetical protein KI688_011315 [Linnemannia hyalina]
MTSTRPREGRGVRNAAGGEHDRLKRAVLQPVQCWDKKWAESKNGKQLQVFKWVKSDRQVDFDDDEDDEEIEQAPIPRQVEEEVGTPIPALPTLQDADDTGASTPAQTGEDDDEDDAVSTTTNTTTTNTNKPSTSNPPATHTSTSPTLSKTERRPSISVSSTLTGSGSSHPETLARKLIREETRGLNNSGGSTTGGSIEDDDEDDTDSSRPLVFTPSLETPVETQANTPQDFESMSPAPMMMDSDEFKRGAEVDLVVKGLDQGQAEMEEEMEEKLVVKEKEQHHHHVLQPVSGSATTSVAVAGGTVVAVEHEHLRTVVSTKRQDDTGVQQVAHEEDAQMEVDLPSVPFP